MGESGPQASQGLSEDGGFRYILVIMDDLSNFVSMEPVEVCTTEATAASLLTWLGLILEFFGLVLFLSRITGELKLFLVLFGLILGFRACVNFY